MIIQLPAALKALGYEEIPTRSQRYRAFTHPNRGKRLLWLGENGDLRVGPSLTASQVVQPSFCTYALSRLGGNHGTQS